MAERPLCFVLMPFGKKKDPGGGPDIDFDAIYTQAIEPAIAAAGMESVRADGEHSGGIIHKTLFERLLLCDFAIADMTTANANVFYELGVRHATRPASTLAIFASHQRLPFDMNYLRALPYELEKDNSFSDSKAHELRDALTERLGQLHRLAGEDVVSDSPLFQLLENYQAPDIARLKTDTFRDRVRYSTKFKQALAKARRTNDRDRLLSIEREMGEPESIETGILVDLFLSYRAVEAWDRMVALYRRLPAALSRSVLIREQLAFAQNRLGEHDAALDTLKTVIEEQGPSSETCGLMGRVYKDLWVEAAKAGHTAQARACLQQATASYERGFIADWRDAYPGINACTLLDIKGDEAALIRKNELLPVVRFAVTQRLQSATSDYWDHATLLELAVLDDDETKARQHLGNALSNVREPWEAKTTTNNLTLIRDARTAHGIEQPWLDDLIQALVATG